ncbi:signal peptidase I [Streptomyces sp. NBC_01264]|uniref:signal peptidase I n=1 Tax=Streptomyces sp. NBC_01264 TaxID=2903804 RepID=UPI0022507A90|nr:signal peptidase I [Streptomyces sp. NBC_01264]MCX4781327.1 signal peptidase I [Streptomyces sp. NBC_01264]
MGDVAVGARSGRDEGGEEPKDFSRSDAVENDGDAKDGAAARPHRSFWKELPLLVGIALLLALLIKTFLVQAFSIPSDSMQNTLQRGDRVLVDKLTPWFGSEPERGEVVVFHDPANWLSGEPTPDPNIAQKALSWIGLMPSAEEKDLIKRTIAIGGDTVECKKGGPVVVNGKELDEPYIYPGNTPCDDFPFGPLTVPKGKIWVMGDHRQNSQDSRYHQQDSTHGFVPVSDVVGRAVVVAWPVTRWSTLPVPDTFDQPGIGTQTKATALGLGAAGLAPVGLGPAALGFAGAVPVALWRRRRLTAGPTGR